jgi:hypothetical protein
MSGVSILIIILAIGISIVTTEWLEVRKELRNKGAWEKRLGDLSKKYYGYRADLKVDFLMYEEVRLVLREAEVRIRALAVSLKTSQIDPKDWPYLAGCFQQISDEAESLAEQAEVLREKNE